MGTVLDGLPEARRLEARRHTVYLVADFAERHSSHVARLGAYTHGKSCLYIRRLADVDLGVLRTLVDRSVRVSRGQDVTRRGQDVTRRA